MKNALVICLFAMVFGLVGCGGGDDYQPPEDAIPVQFRISGADIQSITFTFYTEEGEYLTELDDGESTVYLKPSATYFIDIRNEDGCVAFGCPDEVESEYNCTLDGFMCFIPSVVGGGDIADLMEANSVPSKISDIKGMWKLNVCPVGGYCG